MHQATIIAAKSKMNLLLPIISKIPSELLAVIFSFVKVKSNMFDGKLPQWIGGVSHVCSRWRDIAINSPSLWNDPPVLNATGMAEMLARSKTVDLNIDIFFQYGQHSLMLSVTQAVARHTARIRELSIECIHDMDCIPIAFQNPNWLLESLRLAGHPANQESVRIPDSMLINTRGLRRLDLSFCSFNWDLLTHRNLVNLALWAIAPGTLATLAKLMRVLGTMTALESLTLCSAFEATDGPVSVPVHFESLKTLEIHSDFREVDALFRFICFPIRTRIAIAMYAHDHEEEDIPSFLTTVIGSRSTTPDAVTYRSLGIIEDRGHGSPKIELSLFTDVLEWSTPPSQIYSRYATSHFSLSLKWDDHSAPGPESRVRMVLASFLSSGFAVGKVSHLYLQSDITDVSINPETLVSTIKGLPAVYSIGTTGGMNSSLITALQHRTTDPESGASCFSKLEAISFCRTALDFAFLSPDAGDFDLRILEECLTRRKESKSGIKKLLLERHD